MRTLCLLAIVLGGCSGDVTAAFLSFRSPTVGSTFTRDHVGTTGALVASVPIELDVAGDVARVGISQAEAPLGDLDASGKLAADVTGPGTATLVATAYDDHDQPLVSAQVDVAIADPDLPDCHAWLDLYQQSYTLGPANQGVADPVTAMVPINGITYRYIDNTAPRKTLYGDCTLIKSLLEAAPMLRAKDVTEIADYGVYNYRCIGTGTPPDCPSGLSMHAYAKAIDLAAFKTSDGSTYTVLTDWVIDTSGATCTADTEPGKDAWLHELICTLKKANVWSIVLTPNYNSDHRNHFHVDLTPDADFIKRTTDDYIDD